MGFAQMPGLPVQAGLYAAMVALVAYALLGSSSVLKVETSPSMAVMSAAIVAPLALGDYTYYVTLSAALALVVGVILIGAGLARMGFLADFLAKPVVTGFLFGLALLVIIGQLPSLFGLPSGSGSSLNQLRQFITSLGWHQPIDFGHKRGCLLGASADLDVACTDMLRDLIDELDDASIRLLLADAKGATRSRLEHTGLLRRIGEENLYLRVPEAVEEMRRQGGV